MAKKTATQAEKFKVAAKEADTDQDEAAFKRRLKKITNTSNDKRRDSGSR